MNNLTVIQDDYVQPSLCRPCGGKCCKSMPGAALPTDLGDDIAGELFKRLATGRWAIDWWEGDPTGGDIEDTYFLRPATKYMERVLKDPSNGGPCTFFMEGSGCTIFDERPSGCRGLEPNIDPYKCAPRWASKQDCAIAWVPYQSEFQRVIEAINKVRGTA